MTREDYQALAIVLARTRPIPYPNMHEYEQWRRDVQAIADYCVLDNPHFFNYRRFIDACNGDK